jgi:hypothetical protein
VTRDYNSAYPSPAGQSDLENPLPRGLFIAVAVLGVATYAVSFGPVVNDAGATGWYVRFAAMAALSAAFGLLPRQSPYALVTAILATMGFLDALSSIVMATDSGWALLVIVVLNAVQSAAAVAALVLGPKPLPDNATAGYEAYAEYYNQAVRNYYSQQASAAPPPPEQRSGYGQASAAAQAAPQAQRAQRATQYGDYSEFVGPQGEQRQSAAAPSPPAGPGSPGLPNFAPTQPPAARQEKEADQSAWPPSP